MSCDHPGRLIGNEDGDVFYECSWQENSEPCDFFKHLGYGVTVEEILAVDRQHHEGNS